MIDQKALVQWLRMHPDATDPAAAVKTLHNEMQVPVPMTSTDLMAVLSPESLNRFLNTGLATHIVELIASQDRQNLADWAAALAKGAIITGPEYQSLIGVFTKAPSSAVPAEWAALTTDDVKAAQAEIARLEAFAEIRVRAADGYNRVVTLIDGIGVTGPAPTWEQVTAAFQGA